MAQAKHGATTSSADSSNQTESKFAKHAQDDSALAPNSNNAESGLTGLTFVGRTFIFLLFPTVIGFSGLYMGYLAKRNDPDRDLNFDTDFALPFILALAMCAVIGLQTRGFTTTKSKPLIAWPKVKKRRKIVHKHVVVGQNPDEVEGTPHEPDKDREAKKDD